MASEYLKWKYRDVQPDKPLELTPEQKRRNWWHYHKWHVALGILLVVCAGNIFFHALGIGKIRPDYQIAYVADDPLPADTAAALESAIAALGRDCNGDGRVVVQLNQHVSGANTNASDSAYYATAAAVTLMADMTDCDSYFFLLSDAETFQKNYQLLRRLDGTLPSGTDRDYASCYLAWNDCPVLTALPLGEYTETLLGQAVTGDSQALLSGLSFARRGFWTDKTCDYPGDCDALWDELTKGAL